MVPLCGSPANRRLQLAAAILLVLLSTLLLMHAPLRPVELVSNLSSESTAESELLDVCARLRRHAVGLVPEVWDVMRWVCRKIGADVPPELGGAGCNKSLVYTPIGRLGNLMGLYAIVYSYGRMFGATGYVEDGMRGTLKRYFPNISLPPMSKVPDAAWELITYQQAEEKLACPPEDDGAKPRFFRISNYPDRNGIDVFHPYHEEIVKEFTFTTAMQKQAQEFLRYAKGNRSSVTYIGFHVRRTDYERYIRKQYQESLPDEVYFNKTLSYYRARFADALFIVCSDDLTHVAKVLKGHGDDIVIAGNRNIGDPGRDMALLSACNHSIVTVGTYGFWGAYLAGGTVLVPEAQTHLSRGDRHTPLLEIQLAGATNWIAVR
ncbi:galactoside alpha-(1,2)-fucosyltransferase 2-like [Pollicipes pollicipes]|uniref:galactoside alpha-(1,2)-fucosyltransferase 2-like n=1 Tax=Pollicipes pollicipes TaxID=41117 RepID=UPI0018859741|nr:galactoside alpha-(1,2)-fucosyltransferase 2-like [Pollicipes pollicipes]